MSQKCVRKNIIQALPNIQGKKIRLGKIVVAGGRKMVRSKIFCQIPVGFEKRFTQRQRGLLGSLNNTPSLTQGGNSPGV